MCKFLVAGSGSDCLRRHLHCTHHNGVDEDHSWQIVNMIVMRITNPLNNNIPYYSAYSLYSKHCTLFPWLRPVQSSTNLNSPGSCPCCRNQRKGLISHIAISSSQVLSYGWVNQSPIDDIAVAGLEPATFWLRVRRSNHCVLTIAPSQLDNFMIFFIFISYVMWSWKETRR